MRSTHGSRETHVGAHPLTCERRRVVRGRLRGAGVYELHPEVLGRVSDEFLRKRLKVPTRVEVSTAEQKCICDPTFLRRFGR